MDNKYELKANENNIILSFDDKKIVLSDSECEQMITDLKKHLKHFKSVKEKLGKRKKSENETDYYKRFVKLWTENN